MKRFAGIAFLLLLLGIPLVNAEDPSPLNSGVERNAPLTMHASDGVSLDRELPYALRVRPPRSRLSDNVIPSVAAKIDFFSAAGLLKPEFAFVSLSQQHLYQRQGTYRL